MSHSSESVSSQNFRELAPAAQWSARIDLNSLPFDQFRRAVIATASLARQHYAGFIGRDRHTDTVDSFTLAAYPHRNLSTPTPRTCARYALHLSRRLGVGSVEKDPQHMPGFSRIVLKLPADVRIEGTHGNAVDRAIEDLQAQLGSNALVLPGELFTTLPYATEAIGHYPQPVGVVLAPTPNKHLVYELADANYQKRFTVEDFAATGGLAYMVETRHCTAP